MNQIFLLSTKKISNLKIETIEEEDEFEFLHHTIPQERRVLHMVDAGLGKFDNFSWYYDIFVNHHPLIQISRLQIFRSNF